MSQAQNWPITENKAKCRAVHSCDDADNVNEGDNDVNEGDSEDDGGNCEEAGGATIYKAAASQHKILKNTEPPYQNIQSTKMYPNIFNEICHPLNLKKDLCRKICFITIVVTYKLAELFYMGASLRTNWRGFSQCKKRRGDPIRGGATAGQTGFSF